MIKVCQLGFGGMGRSHFAAYEKLEAKSNEIKLVALCDINPDQFRKAVKTNLEGGSVSRLDGRRLYTDFDEMMKNEECDIVDIVLPTHLHAEYTIRALEYGRNVLCEKPMARHSADCRRMIEAAEKYGKKLMVGQCLRFEPLYLYLKELIDNKTFGAPRSMFFDRLSPLPRWGKDSWYADVDKSGGCALDLHIHDVDMIRFLLGEPDAVSAVAEDNVTRWQLMNSRFTYSGVPVVVATGSWTEPHSTKFKMGYRVRFETAGVVLDGGKVTVYPDEGTPYEPELPSYDRIAAEISFLADIITKGRENLTNTPESAMKTVELVETLCRSADRGGELINLK